MPESDSRRRADILTLGREGGDRGFFSGLTYWDITIGYCGSIRGAASAARRPGGMALRAHKRKQKSLDTIELPAGGRAVAVAFDEWGRSTPEVQRLLRDMAKEAVSTGAQRLLGTSLSGADAAEVCQSQLVRRWREYLSVALTRTIAAGLDSRVSKARREAADLEILAGRDAPMYVVKL